MVESGSACAGSATLRVSEAERQHEHGSAPAGTGVVPILAVSLTRCAPRRVQSVDPDASTHLRICVVRSWAVVLDGTLHHFRPIGNSRHKQQRCNSPVGTGPCRSAAIAPGGCHAVGNPSEDSSHLSPRSESVSDNRWGQCISGSVCRLSDRRGLRSSGAVPEHVASEDQKQFDYVTGITCVICVLPLGLKGTYGRTYVRSYSVGVHAIGEGIVVIGIFDRTGPCACRATAGHRRSAAASADGEPVGSNASEVHRCRRPGDPLALANASLQASKVAAQTAVDLGRKFLAGLGVSGSTAGASTGQVNRVNGPASHRVRDSASRLADGCAVLWGGAASPDPAQGRRRRRHRGFDCSGLTRYAFAGVGVLLPRWSGISTPRAATFHPRKPNAVTCCSGDPAAASTRLCI